MLIAIIQTFAVAVACGALYFLWVKTAPSEGLTRNLLVIGFLFRAFVGQVLFWISYLRLPVARNLQLGNGLWFFALDAEYYVWLAASGASSGFISILRMSRFHGSVVFVQALSIFMALFGDVSSVGLILNLFCFLGTCAIILRWGSVGKQTASGATLAIAAVALSPSAILWTLQPLKDPLFILLVVAFIAACAAWQRTWTADLTGRRMAGVVLAGLAMVLTLYGIAGIRWYVATAMLAASGVFVLLVAVNASGRRVTAFIAGVFLLVLLSQALVRSAGPYLPLPLQRVLDPVVADGEIGSLDQTLLGMADRSRAGFERTRGATSIAAGPAIYEEGSRRPLPRGKRLLTGLAAFFLPRTLAQSLGFIEVGGGKGLWLFAEVDTFLFDALLLIVVIFAIRSARGGSFRSPVFWLLLLLIVLLTVPLVYAVTNFGTLFRQRLMIYSLLALVPIALSTPAIDRARRNIAQPSVADH